jgi:basic membrane protein A and related proteins
MALTAGAALAEPAIIFDLGGKFDKSFNEAPSTGAEKWAKETGGTYIELEMQRGPARTGAAPAGRIRCEPGRDDRLCLRSTC